MQHYRKRCRETLDKGLSPYDGHDTVGIIGLDKQGLDERRHFHQRPVYEKTRSPR